MDEVSHQWAQKSTARSNASDGSYAACLPVLSSRSGCIVTQGTEGIAWLCTCAAESIDSGAFYLDRSPQPKHIAGAFFSEGKFTKNSPEEVCRSLHAHDHLQS